MLEIFRTLVTPQGFIPHGHCYLWKPGLVWLHTLSDFLIVLAYYSIPFMLVYFVHKRRDLPFDWIFWLFGSFIVACGTTHLLEIWTIWHPTYWLLGFIKAITALVSLSTAVLLVPLIPKALALPSPAQLEVTNLTLRQEIAQRKLVEEALKQANEQLEIRVLERTAELALINESLQAEIETNKQTEEALNRREQEFKALVENAPDIIARIDRNLRHIYVNPAIELATGLSPDTFIGKTNRDLGISEELVGGWESVIQNVFETGQEGVMEFQFSTPNGLKYYQSRLVPELAQDGTIASTLSIARDITFVKQVEEELRKSLKDLSDIKFALDQSVILAITDINGVITYVNDKFCEISKYSQEELIGKTHKIINSNYHPKALFQDLWLTISAGKVWQGEIKNRAKDGTDYWVDTAIVPFLNEQGKPFQYLAIRFDITERKHAEQEIRVLNSRLESRVAERTAELEAANKELEAFSYSVSHDLRAPLRAIDGFSQALLDCYTDKLDDKGKHYLQRIRAGTQRMGELIDDLLKLSRVTRSEMQRTKVDVSTLAQEIAAELHSRQPERNVEWSITSGLVVQGDARLLRIVLENLLNNAWKFTSSKIHSRIEFNVIVQGYQLIYFVRDNGVGFNMAYAKKLFGAFQRLHSVNQFPGTGIGLATVQRIIHRHGGRVWAESIVEQGATFYFTL